MKECSKCLVNKLKSNQTNMFLKKISNTAVVKVDGEKIEPTKSWWLWFKDAFVGNRQLGLTNGTSKDPLKTRSMNYLAIRKLLNRSLVCFENDSLAISGNVVREVRKICW